MPIWLQVTLAVLLPLETAVIAYLFATRTKNRELTGEYQVARVSAESTFIGHLMARVSALEVKDTECQARLLLLEGKNATLAVTVETLRYELAERITNIEVASHSTPVIESS